jgi:hypothetical protein
MPLLASVSTTGTQQPRSGRFWIILGAVAAGQLFAFWLLCSHQVRKAEARHNEAVMQQMALSDCLQYIPGSTIASCSGRPNANANAQPAGRAATNSALNGALPVSFSYR